MQKYIKINPNDKVAVALEQLQKGLWVNVDNQDILLTEDIPSGHKFALADIPEGHEVIKYGNSIGIAKETIKQGEWVHTHNLKTALGDLLSYQYQKKELDVQVSEEATFLGYRRANGLVGVRNELWVIPTVGCVNNVATAIAEKAQKYVCENIEAVVAFPHPYGCSQMGEDQENTRRILADLVNHPNAGGVLVLGLGCENSNIEELKKYIGKYDDKRVKFLVAQESEDEIEDSLQLLEELYQYAGEFKREPISCKELVIGLKCGGSDGFSGITANPTVGAFSDLLISKGGTTILTEVPEMFGAETLLMNRCENEELFKKTVDLINDFKNYFSSHNQTIYENPSPGNKKGGISTLEDKSLGCVQKSGTALVKGVLGYGEQVKGKGLNLLSAPGNDLVASTALAAAGAHIVLFTTGRGTPFASPVPTVKISSNSPLSQKKSNWIDFNCGSLVESVEEKDKESLEKVEVTQALTIEVLAQKLFDYVISVASGELVKAEAAGFHDMAIFKQGVTL